MCERVGFDPGNRLIQQGDLADAAYLIIEGHAEVILETPNGPLIVATVGVNEIVGVLGVLGNAPRAATVRAKDRLIALRIPKEPFMRMVREVPTIAISIIQDLARRLADLTEIAVSTDGGQTWVEAEFSDPAQDNEERRDDTALSFSFIP